MPPKGPRRFHPNPKLNPDELYTFQPAHFLVKPTTRVRRGKSAAAAEDAMKVDEKELQSVKPDTEQRPNVQAASSRARELMTAAVEKILENPPASFDQVDIMSGVSGIAFLFLKLHLLDSTLAFPLGSGEELTPCIEIAKLYIDRALYLLDSETGILPKAYMCGMMTSKSGVYALAAVVYSKLSSGDHSQLVQSFIDAANCKNFSQKPSTPSDLYEGKLGYLYTLLFLRSHLDNSGVTVPPLEAVLDMTGHILDVGEHGAKRLFGGVVDRDGASRLKAMPTPFLWNWGMERFVGVRGIAGGIAMLASVCKAMPADLHPTVTPVETGVDATPDPKAGEHPLTRPMVLDAVKRCLGYLSRHARLFNGNYLLRADDHPLYSAQLYDDTEMVGFTHGAAGVGLVLCHVARVLENAGPDFAPLVQKCIHHAKDCGQVVWERGLVRSGTGLSYGVTGNAYLFLALWKTTGETSYLHRAAEFMDMAANWSQFDNSSGQESCSGESEPLDFFYGSAGMACFFADMAYPSKFEGFPLFTST
ncbi:MAG: hypothetical protein SGCHY_000461 [Lobulomycetales sp.]